RLRLRGRCRELLHLLDAERLSRRPRRQLVDLAGADQLVVADQGEPRLASVAPHLDAALLKALRDPADCVLLADLPGEDVAHLRARLGEWSVALQFRSDK